MDAATLRDLDQLDSEALKALILALREQVFSHRKQLTTQQEEILSQREQLASRDAEIEHLKLLIAKLRRQQFGRSSEKREYQIEQLELRLEELEARRTKETAAVKESTPASTVAVRPVTCTASLDEAKKNPAALGAIRWRLDYALVWRQNSFTIDTANGNAVVSGVTVDQSLSPGGPAQMVFADDAALNPQTDPCGVFPLLGR